MKTKKLVIYIVSFIVVSAVAFATYYGLKSDKVEVSDPEMYVEYITAYTNGLVSKNTVVTVKFTETATANVDTAKVKASDILKLSPDVNGDYYWVDKQTIEFKPRTSLPSQTRFEAEVHLDKMLEMPNGLETFKFSFITIKQNIKIEINEVITLNEQDYSLQKVVGSVSLADDETPEKIQEIVNATHNGKKVNLKWENSSGRIYTFTADSIARTEDASSIIFEWNGSIIDVDKEGTEKVEIPSLSEFKPLWHKVLNSPEQGVIIQFSDPLDSRQEINGLIAMGDESGLKIEIKNNCIYVYPPTLLEGDYVVTAYRGIANTLGKKTETDYTFSSFFENIKPQVKMSSNGTILPSSDNGLVIPFDAVSLREVDVRIVRIYENNVTQFLQVNDINGNSELARVGKIVVEKSIPLDEDPNLNLNKWNKFYLDLNELIKVEPGAIYRVSIGFRQHQSVYACNSAEEEGDTEGEGDTETEESETPAKVAPISNSFEYFGTYYDPYNEEYGEEGGDYYYYDDDYYNNYWENRENPCHRAYYGSQHCVSQNILASNLGLIAKRANDGSLTVIATDLLTAKPLSGVSVEVIDYTKQILGRAETNSDGIATFGVLEKPFVVVATSGKNKAYLKISGGLSLSLSSFDVSGVSVQDGMKGFIYGERGVWRPGDTIFLTFILDEEGANLPANHPVTLELRNPSYQMVKKITKPKNKNNFYRFDLITSESDPTGNWEAKIIVGGATFYKTLKVETIRPNRLKMRLEFPTDKFFSGTTTTGTLNSSWLHGAPAINLSAQVDVMLSSIKTTFPNFKDYVFDDNGKKFYPTLVEVFNGKLDENGNAKIAPSFDLSKTDVPGFVNAVFITKVFEASGNFSIDQFKYSYSPYETYVGVKIPQPEKGQYYLYTDTNQVAEIVAVNQNGKLNTTPREVEAMIYKLDWNWWWNQNDGENQYSAHSYLKPYKTEKIKLVNGKGVFKFRLSYPDWGRYLIKISDPVTGHSSASVAYFDWPGYRSRENRGYSETSTMLSFTTDKVEYNTGEKVTVTFPSSEGGHAFVSLESGKGIIKQFWVPTTKEQTVFDFPAEPSMAPNIFINITLLQPHAQALNDLPIRLYGIAPISVEDPNTHLVPEIKMPDKLRSETTVSVNVSEKNKKAMTYTLAIVDEGLLDLTKFKTPDPWEYFFAREALGVTTWDMFNDVIGSFGKELERILSIGGGEDGDGDKTRKANRFKPMVVFIGPFDLPAGKTNTHKIEIPNYIGSVRTMVIAGSKNAYGFADKTTPVTKPLAVITEMPRLLSPGDKIKLPVTVFAFEKHVKNATIQLKTNKLLKIEGSNQKSVKFGKYNEQVVEFDIATTSQTGIAEVEVIATSGKEKSTYKIELDVRYPNLPMTNVVSQMAEAGTEVTIPYVPVGLPGTNKSTLELSSIPPLNLEKRLKFLVSYPHGCVEQTTSSAFPQLYLENLVQLTKEKKEEISRNIKAAIDRLMKFQNYTGGLSYWPGNGDADEWGTSYAGHFIIEARKKGYQVSESFMKKWLKYQQQKARNWTDNGASSQLTQSYRLYTLALYGKPESGAMNRLKEIKNLYTVTSWQLAAGYAVSGKMKAAETLVQNLATTINPYKELYYTYGSDLRDEAIILETLSKMGKRKQALQVLKGMSDKLSSEYWYSTQSTAWSLMAVSSFLGNQKADGKISAQYSVNNSSKSTISTDKPMFIEKLQATDKGCNVVIKNNASGPLFIRVVSEGIPAPGQETDLESNLRLSYVYTTPDGVTISPLSIRQGTDLFITITVTNPTNKYYHQMSLNHLLPTGFEIMNTRMMEIEGPSKFQPNYQDIRDDRVYSYFDIPGGTSRTLTLMVNASFRGTFYLPAIECEAMYDAEIAARKKGMWINIY